ncbi:MAG: MaoC family dehydratase [Planctomycetales bacterium]|nr:MaoC family dehydratase [Planctomycetales bacterium]
MKSSEWLDVEQDTILQFADCTMDRDWLHTDPDRASVDSPFGTTIAHGFWTVSMLTCFSRQMIPTQYPEGMLYGLNYGLDRVRFMSPIPIRSRIRCHGQLLNIVPRGENRCLVRSKFEIEVEGQEKPAMSAERLCLFGFPE